MPILREISKERDNWKKIADSIGYNYYDNGDGTFAWNEKVRYSLSQKDVSNIEKATEELHNMCLEVVNDVIMKGDIEKFHIPEKAMDYVSNSWKQSDFLIGRFDFAWTPSGLKMIEYNADTPATIPESTEMLRLWLKDLKMGNFIKNKLSYFKSLPTILSQNKIIIELTDFRYVSESNNIHIIPYPDNVEDKTHGIFWAAFAKAAGWNPILCELEDLQVTEDGNFIHKGITVDNVIRMYPWEFMLREEGCANLYKNSCNFMNPAWTTLLSNKALLPTLWEKFPNHPLLIPSFWDKRGMTDYVTKPIHSRGGENVKIFVNNELIEDSEGSYNDYKIVYQEKVDTRYIDSSVSTSLGSWIVGSNFAGITFREDERNVVRNCSPIVPHYIR